jgi:putative endonuclease
VIKHNKKSKIQSYQQGHTAEALAAMFLRLKGYRIVNRRYKTPMGEIDIVALKKKTIVMVEVKTRQAITDALEAITPKNRYRVTQAAKFFMAAHPALGHCDVRFDVVVVGRVLGMPLYLQHLDNAWQAES